MLQNRVLGKLSFACIMLTGTLNIRDLAPILSAVSLRCWPGPASYVHFYTWPKCKNKVLFVGYYHAALLGCSNASNPQRDSFSVSFLADAIEILAKTSPRVKKTPLNELNRQCT